jgi:hypothetical protein
MTDKIEDKKTEPVKEEPVERPAPPKTEIPKKEIVSKGFMPPAKPDIKPVRTLSTETIYISPTAPDKRFTETLPPKEAFAVLQNANVSYGTKISEIVRAPTQIGKAIRTMLALGYPQHIVAAMLKSKGDQWFDVEIDTVKEAFDSANMGHRAEVLKKVDYVIEGISNREGHDTSRAWEYLVEFLAAAFNQGPFPELKKETLIFIYENFPITEIRNFKADYLGSTQLLRLNSHMGQFFTPANICKMIAAMQGVENSKPGQTIMDPCLGTGGMLLAAMDMIKPGVILFGIEKDMRLYRAALVNMFLYCPIMNPFYIINADALTGIPDWSKADIVHNKTYAHVGTMNEVGKKENRDFSAPSKILMDAAQKRMLHLKWSIDDKGKIGLTPIQKYSPTYYQPTGIYSLVGEKITTGKKEKK